MKKFNWIIWNVMYVFNKKAASKYLMKHSKSIDTKWY